MDIEISVQSNTAIEILGSMPEETVEEEFEQVSFEQISLKIGKNVCKFFSVFLNISY